MNEEHTPDNIEDAPPSDLEGVGEEQKKVVRKRSATGKAKTKKTIGGAEDEAVSVKKTVRKSRKKDLSNESSEEVPSESLSVDDVGFSEQGTMEFDPEEPVVSHQRIEDVDGLPDATETKEDVILPQRRDLRQVIMLKRNNSNASSGEDEKTVAPSDGGQSGAEGKMLTQVDRKGGSHGDFRQNKPDFQNRFKKENGNGAKFEKKHFDKKNKKDKSQNRERGNGPRFRSQGFGGDTKGLDIGDLPYYGLFAQNEELETLSSGLRESGLEPLSYNHIYTAPIQELLAWAQMKGLLVGHAPNRGLLIDSIVQQAATDKQEIRAVGVLDIIEGGIGLLVFESDSYAQSPRCIYVDRSFIRLYGLQAGHIITVQIHPRHGQSTCPYCIRVIDVMGKSPEELSGITPFNELIPYYPLERIRLETDGKGGWDNISMRIVDMLSPVGLGQRGLIVAPPRVGKTVFLQGIANAIQSNYPGVHLIVLLIDERPEEVTDFKRQVKGEVISSTFDESAESHCHAAEMVIEKARRMVEQGQHVVILLDSITRLARAYNTMSPSSGKILSGGVEANALQKPKRFFGSARNIEGGGSLTILGTALIETGSKMDEVIFEEFKGTGNMELHLDRELADKRIFPAINMDKSGTRKEELLYHKDEMNKIYSLRRAMKGVPSTDAMELLIQRVRKTQTNAEFLMSMNR